MPIPIAKKIEVRPHAIKRLHERFEEQLRLSRKYYQKGGKGFAQGPVSELLSKIFKHGENFMTMEYKRKGANGKTRVTDNILIKKCAINRITLFLFAVIMPKREKIIIRTVYTEEMVGRIINGIQQRIDTNRMEAVKEFDRVSTAP